MGMDNQLTSAGGALDLVITNVDVVDPTIGVVKADVGIKDGKIVGIGKAGNPGPWTASPRACPSARPRMRSPASS